MRSAVDLVAVSRVERLIRENAAAIGGLCTRRELEEWRGMKALAQLLAAKEAVLKALGSPGADEVNWHDLEVTRSPLGVRFTGALAGQANVAARWLISTAVSTRLAAAWVAAEGTD